MRPEHWLYTIPLRLRSLIRRDKVEQELSDELQYHVDQKTRDYIAAGLTPGEARRKATREFGGVEQSKEYCRDARRVNWIQDLIQDLRYGLRMLRKSPGFTFVTVLTLALGIGANTAIFSVVNGVLLYPLPYSQPQELIELHETSTTWGTDSWGSASGRDFNQWREQSRSFSGLAACFEDGLNLTGTEQPERIRSFHVSADFFRILGAQPALGNLFSIGDFQPGAAHVAVLSNSLWHLAFGADPGIVGKAVTLSGQVYTIAGVTSRDFVPFGHEQLWTPLTPDNPTLQDPSSHWLAVIGRLKSNVSLEAAR